MAGYRMRNLTLASAKHLLSQGHITKAHHQKIMDSMAAPTMPKMPKMPKGPGLNFGALSKMAAPLPQPGMQASLPGVANGGGSQPFITPGMVPGYEK
jgi:hypothetical protein